MLEHNPKRRLPLETEYNAILQNYKEKHYEIATMKFNKVFMYQNQNKDLRLFSEDGKRWTIEELQNGQWVRGKFALILKNGTPDRIYQLIENVGLYDLLRSGVYADFVLELVEEPEKPIAPVARPVPPKKYNCEDQGQEHKYNLGTDKVFRCMICGAVKKKE